MKKRIISVLIAIILVFGLLIILHSNNKNVYTEIDGVKYAIFVNGESSSSFPSGNNYKVDVNCTNASAYYNTLTSKVIIKNIKGNVTCDISFTTATDEDYLNNFITKLEGSDEGDGKIVSENGIRYEGKNPDNYIMFNNELWRIIGVFETEYDSNNDGVIDENDTTGNLVKIIREDSIGVLAWNKSNSNDWPNSTLYHLLNYEYYDWNTNKGTVSTYCYGYSSTTPARCDYSVKGIQDGYRGMIVKSKWYLGGGGKSGYTTYTPDNVYSYERNANTVYGGRSSSTLGYVGLMYESDYLYGVLASDCARTTTHESYNTASCAGKDWLFGKGKELTISPRSNGTNTVWVLVYFGGYINGSYANIGGGVGPTLYLSPSVYRVGGTGSITDPYIIGMPTS